MMIRIFVFFPIHPLHHGAAMGEIGGRLEGNLIVIVRSAANFVDTS